MTNFQNSTARHLIDKAKAVIFDVDGLLIDSEPVWQKALFAFFERHNLDIEQISFDPMGMGLKDCILLFQKELGLKGNMSDLMREFRTIFYEYFFKQNENILKEGTRELVHALEGKKKLAIATGGHTKKMMESMLEQLDLRKYFTVIVSSDQVSLGKPAPDVFLFTVKELDIPASDCVVLEDSLNGVYAAKSAHIRVIAVNNDSKIYKKLIEIHPDALLYSLSELL